jgi:GTP-binding protein HflX
LVEAFKSTLDEVREADLLLHVVDASHPNAASQVAAGKVVLQEIEAADKPQLLVYNKADRLPVGDVERLSEAPGAVVVSAQTGAGLDRLLARIAAVAAQGEQSLTALVPYERGDLVRLAHERGHIRSEEHTAEGTLLTFVAPAAVTARFSEFALDARD